MLGAGRRAMKRLLVLFGGLVLASAARAQDAPVSRQCGLASTLIVAQDQGTVTINCSGVTAEYGEQLAALMTQILQDRLDPQAVLGKLDEIESAPAAGRARKLDDAQRQAIIQSLVGKPPQQIAIIAHSGVPDSADYGKDIAAPLTMVGWRIEGNQIKRAVPEQFDEVRGVALLVRSKDPVPEKATLLRTALTSARITAPILVDPSLPNGAVVLWIGPPPAFMSAEQKP